MGECRFRPGLLDKQAKTFAFQPLPSLDASSVAEKIGDWCLGPGTTQLAYMKAAPQAAVVRTSYNDGQDVLSTAVAAWTHEVRQ
jgi:hypothetical protein